MLQIDCRKLKLSLHFSEPKGSVCSSGTTAQFLKKSFDIKTYIEVLQSTDKLPYDHSYTQQSLFTARSCQLERKAVFFSNTSHTFSPRAGYPTVTSPELFTTECCQAEQRTQTHILPEELCFHVPCTQANDQLAHRSWPPD